MLSQMNNHRHTMLHHTQLICVSQRICLIDSRKPPQYVDGHSIPHPHNHSVISEHRDKITSFEGGGAFYHYRGYIHSKNTNFQESLKIHSRWFYCYLIFFPHLFVSYVNIKADLGGSMQIAKTDWYVEKLLSNCLVSLFCPLKIKASNIFWRSN